MEIFREILSFFISQLDVIAIILLSTAIVILSIAINNQKLDIKKLAHKTEGLQREITEIKNKKYV